MLKLDRYEWKWKIPIPLAFPKLVLKVKVKFLLISWHFLVAFSLRPPNPPIHWNSHFCYTKCIQLVHIWAKFHLCLTCSYPVLKFQMFSAEGTILGCFWAFFLDVTHWNMVKFVWNFDQWCNVTQCIRNMMVFILFLKNTWNWAKFFFLAHFERFLVYAFLSPVSYTPIFKQM